jgi:hypothetical protein
MDVVVVAVVAVVVVAVVAVVVVVVVAAAAAVALLISSRFVTKMYTEHSSDSDKTDLLCMRLLNEIVM